jgi:DNA-binding response OmpR family regulator
MVDIITMSTNIKRNILILDDDKNIGRLLELILQTSRFAVTRATNVEKALKRVKAKKPDLIISDIMLQNETGFDLYWKLLLS